MASRLTLQSSAPTTEGVVFHLVQDGRAIPPDRWPGEGAFLAGEDDRPACKETLLRMLDEGLATLHEDRTGPGILVDHRSMAALPPRELACLGLPPRSPHVLQVSGNGPISAPDFRFLVRLVAPTGIPLATINRTGSFLHGPPGKQWILPLPYLEVLDAIDAWEARPPESSLEERMALVGRVLDLLPDGARVDDTLKTIHVRWCDSFSLRPFRNRHDEPDFDPVPLARPGPEPGADPEPQPALRGQRQEFFADQFRRRPRLFPSYAAGNGWYVVLSPRAVAALRVVKEIQADSDPHRRLAFLRNPHGFLRDALEEALPPGDLEDIFLETPEFSERVREIGAWQPPSLPFYRSGTEWLPPASLPADEEAPSGKRRPEIDEPVAHDTGSAPAVVVAGCPIRRDELQEVMAVIAEAMESGRDTAEWGGHRIPATREVYRTLEAASQQKDPPNQDPIVLHPHQNLEEVEFRERFRRHEKFPVAPPSSLLSRLFPHQQEGLRWLQASWLAGVPGVLLADDMGLGKTLQVLSFFAWLRDALSSQGSAARFLVVGPTALIQNWLAEIDRHFAPDTFGEVVPLQGSRIREYRLPSAGRGKETIAGLPVLDTVKLRSCGMLLCSYEVLRDYQHSLGCIPWTVMALDEAQKIKNPTTLVSSVARAMNAEFVVAMTGTPVENRMADLWSILDAIRPGRYGSLRDFTRKYEGPIAEIRERLERLGRELSSPDGGSPIMLRRLKKDHLDGLPGIHVHKVRKTMPAEQARAYDAVVQGARRADVSTRQILGVIQQLRAVSLHPALADETIPAGPDSSARFSALLEILDDVAQHNEKALVFVDSRPAQDMLVGLLARRYELETPPFVINGAVPGGARKRRIDEFQERNGFDVLILSPMAAGVGLNLVAANHVIHLGRWWNPAVEDQATDRAYRIGQERDVHVHVPLAIHPEHQDASFDVRLDQLLEHKRALHQTLLAPAAASRQELGDFLEELLRG